MVKRLAVWLGLAQSDVMFPWESRCVLIKPLDLSRFYNAEVSRKSV